MDPKYLDAILKGTATPEMSARPSPADAGPANGDPPGTGEVQAPATLGADQSADQQTDPGEVGGGGVLGAIGLGGIGKSIQGFFDEGQRQLATDPNWAGFQENMSGVLKQQREKQDLPGQLLGDAAMGGLKSVFETSDFLFGDTPRDRQTPARQMIEQEDQDAKAESPLLAGLSSGIGQFTTAMIGLGKLGMVAKAIPGVEGAVAAVEGIKGGAMALESSKAALAGFIAFDPHEERLSNAIQGMSLFGHPLANPLTEWLAAKPGDTATWGRVKNAMESLGMDAAIIGTLKAGTMVYKYLKAGDQKGATRAINDFEEARALDPEAVPDTQQADPGAGVPDQQAVPGSPATPGVLAEDTGAPHGGDVVSEPAPAVPGAAPDAAGGEVPGGELAGVATPQAADELATPVVVKGKNVKPYTENPIEFQPGDLAGKEAEVGMGPRQGGLIDDMPFMLENAEKDLLRMDSQDHTTALMQVGRDPQFSADLSRFYDHMHTDSDVVNFIDVAVAHKMDEMTKAGFRSVVSDKKVAAQVSAYARLVNQDPTKIIGMLQAGGEAMKQMAARMITVGSLASKAFTDATLLTNLMKTGDYSTYGTRAAMEDEILKRMSLATNLFQMTDQYRSNFGRGLRAQRGKWMTPELFNTLDATTKERVYNLIQAAQGNPVKFRYLADPSIWEKTLDVANYIRINGLVSGYTSQAVNFMTNTYMVGARPMERIFGATLRLPYDIVKDGAAPAFSAASTAYVQNMKQYLYMGSAFWDSFKQASVAFLRHDSVLNPHGDEALTTLNRWQVPGSQALAPGFFKPWDGVGNLVHNAFSVPMAVIGTPTRVLGAADELMKQVVYRSKVMANASVEGLEAAGKLGLDGKDAKAYVKNYVGERLNNAFDASGRGTDAVALSEANIATFQQDLLQGTFGKTVQNAVYNDKTGVMRFLLPFVKTPTNVLRYGWKMTPLLNGLQGEYRDMIRGAMGREAQMQAMGQMTMGALAMGAIAFLGKDQITGGGPSDPGLKAELLNTGYRPYSIIHVNDDGTKTFIPYNRYDPIGLPLGIMADIQDAIHVLGDDATGSAEMQQAIGALGISLAKQFTNRTYLQGINQALDALSDPGKRGQGFAGNFAASFVPFSAATRQMSTDPYLRDARTITDKLMNAVPGLSQSIRPKYSWLGQPELARPGLWSSDNGSLVDNEVQRLGMLPDAQLIQQPSPMVGKVDLRQITMENGDNAYDAYQRLSGKPVPGAPWLRDVVADIMRSDGYKRSADGDAGIKGTKLYLLHGAVYKYRNDAMKILKGDANVQAALRKDKQVVSDHWKGLTQPVSPEQRSTLQNIMRGFGAATNQGQ